MTIAEMLADRLSKQLPHVKHGSLRISGEWSGRPYDNVHTVIAALAQGDTLTVSFDQGETLAFENPDEAVFDQNTFEVGVASRAR
ncbi:hypothetical protein [Lichenicola sp.]|uniref:hypothetical protein n=1 Tax=Lichenicola sp. TaxID=2804529 RepID=UPI003AFFF197